MKPIVNLEQTASFENVIAENTQNFAMTATNMLQTIFGKTYAADNSSVAKKTLQTEKNFFVSMFFTGTVYGEYILAFNDEHAANITGKTLVGKTGAELAQARIELSQDFSDLLNMTVGQSIVHLNQIYKKLTITPPRSSFGSLSYPEVTMGSASLRAGNESIDCYLYVDRMKLDIADSYKEALSTALQAHQELQAAMKKLQVQQTLLVQSEKMAALGTMAAGVAHEINTPLATVSLVGDRLKSLLGQKDEVDKIRFLTLLDTIGNTVEKIARITNGMREFAQGVRKDQPKKNSLNQVMANALLICEMRVVNLGIDLKIQGPAQDLFLDCRSPEISQVFVHLIENSCDAVEGSDKKWIHIDLSENENSVEFAIKDSGQGIPAQIRDSIFDPFFTTKDIGKKGLGLSIAKGLVERHGGEIGLDADSAATCFRVRLPKRASIQKVG